ncbi:MAG: tetratricopeptide repeat protein [Smithellaceae bacterium]|jgi:tetratricopeptide (TPR) repeat protein
MDNNNAEKDRMNFLDQAEDLLQHNMFSEALSLAEARLARLPLDVDARVIASNVFIGMGRVDEARDVLREVEKIISGLSLVYVRVGDIYREKGFYRDAVICYQKYISWNPTSDKAEEVVGKIALLEQEEPLIADMDSTDNENTSKPEFYTVTLADLYIKQGHFKMAAEVLEKILEEEPENVLARTKLDTITTAIALKSPVNGDIVQSDNLAKTLSCWLENINRLKKHAAEK